MAESYNSFLFIVDFKNLFIQNYLNMLSRKKCEKEKISYI